jgi:hypothetical protein
MNLAPPIPRFGRGRQLDEEEVARERSSAERRLANRAPAKSPTQVLQR